MIGCSGSADTGAAAFTAMAKLCEPGSKQTITYRIQAWNGFLETKCEFIVTEEVKEDAEPQ